MNFNIDLTVLSTFIMNNIQYMLLAMTIMILVALIIFISINLKLSKMNKRYRKMMQGAEGANLEQLLMNHIDEVRQVVDKVEYLSTEYKRIDKVSKACIQKLGVVRFNAFEDTGSDLSFAVALLDANNNGVVISSIFGRSESRSYGKPVVAGQSSYFLTEEEKQAIAQACEKKITQ
ncbi:DUF4446 family protein [Dendrosporobacter sp. 1207_IL3150]|uniref:DUF4446 family protein n=1 Tax=Dendrosporobacter sp. 1207_IL3150 TaxID=3084054 RepID=UPI002FD9EB2E